MSTRRKRSNQPIRHTGRRAVCAIAVAVLGVAAGSSLAAAEETPEDNPAETTGTAAAEEIPVEIPEETTGTAAVEETMVIEVVVESPPAHEPMAAPTADSPPDDSTASIAPTSAPIDSQHEGDDAGEGDHGGNGSGEQGEGNPYRMAFSVDWRSEAGRPIAVLDQVLADDWRTLFTLTAASQTGKNQPTAARCTYTESSNQLECEYDNPGHRSDADGMIVPARPTATYSVTVRWETPGWTVDGANAGPYSARDLCPRGGNDGGHDDGHDELTDVDDNGHSGKAFRCEHTVVIRAIQVAPPEPEPEPPTGPESATPTPEQEQASLPPVVMDLGSTAQMLPATGSPTSLMLAIGGVLSAIGAGLVLLARRISTDPIGGAIGDQGRMPT